MTRVPGWNAQRAIANLQAGPWRGRAWRFHRRSYGATDSAGSLLVSGRYHRARDQFSGPHGWAALYLALAPEVSLGEILHRLSPETMADLNDYRLSELEVELAAVLDCRDAAALGLSANDLIRDYDFTVTQRIAAAAMGKWQKGSRSPPPLS